MDHDPKNYQYHIISDSGVLWAVCRDRTLVKRALTDLQHILSTASDRTVKDFFNLDDSGRDPIFSVKDSFANIIIASGTLEQLLQIKY